MKLFVNDLTVMDFSYLCPRRGMVGESWIVDVILDGALNDESMIQDFGIVKKQLKRLIDDYVDHKLLVPADHPNSTIYAPASDGRIQVDFDFADTHAIQLFCPPEAYAFVYALSSDSTLSSSTTHENATISKALVNAYLKDVIATHLPDNVQDIQLILREEVIQGPFYHYTHGLKKHDGNCQRIAHGHRSKIIIKEDEKQSHKLEEYWASRWADIYIGTKEDLVNPDQMSFKVKNHDTMMCFKYEASQGEFEMAIAKHVCEIIEQDTTVECLAQFVLQSSKQMSSSKLEVRAFEGVGKGALVFSS